MIWRFVRTVRHLRPVQIAWRLWLALSSPSPDARPAPPLRQPLADLVRAPLRPPAWKGGRTFRFLNVERELQLPEDWNRSDWPRLWLYNLHYFDDLWSTKAAGSRDFLRRLISLWVEGNPPAEGIGWESYPISVRVLNWIRWDVAHRALPDEARHSLAIQARYLCHRLEHHLLGNHLLTNATALVATGLYFQGIEASAFRRRGMMLLARQLDEQILSDGGHFELSPMYQSLIAEGMLHLVNLHRTYGEPYPEAWDRLLDRMLGWLACMCHPDGEISFFNDAAFGVALPPHDLFEYAKRLGFEAPAAPSVGITHLAESGYARLDLPPAVALLDIASLGPDYLPGHGHADTLSFEFSLNGRRVIVNEGTATYDDSPLRRYQRSTPAHNALTFNGRDSSEVWGSFRVGKRARVCVEQVQDDGTILKLRAVHNGFGNVIHRRTWRLERGELRIVDEVSGGRRLTAEIQVHFHLHPDVAARDVAGAFVLEFPSFNGSARLILDREMTGALRPSRYSPEFGLLVPTVEVLGSWHGGTPVRLVHRLEWDVL